MNFVGKFDAKLPVDGSGAPYVAHTHVDAASTHAPSDAIIIPDAKLLFEGDFKRSGVDLVLSKDDHEMVVHDYFKGEKRAALSSPDGAHLTGDIVNALTGHVEYAQAGGAVAAAAAVVGHVTKITGNATAIRNGVSIILNQGDNVEKGDVLQSGADSALGVTFIDGTVFGLSSNARMVVNEMIYDPNGSNNSSLLSLVAGTISFVAGETAKHGDMKVDTPVATMGIRGTAVLVEIDFGIPGTGGAPSANFQVLVEPDGTTGSYILFDKSTLTPLATVNAAGTLTKISQGVVSFQSGTGLTADEQKLISDVFQQKFSDNSNPKSLDHQFTDSIVPLPFGTYRLPDGTTAVPIVLVFNNNNGPSSGSSSVAPSTQHIPGAPAVVTVNSAFTEHSGVSGSPAPDTVIGQIKFLDINIGDRPSVTVKFDSFNYQDAHNTNITNSLTAAELAAVKAVETIHLATDPDNTNFGSATFTYSFPDGAFDFLAAGEKLTLTYQAFVNNNYPQSPETGIKSFTITITGTNDVPVITSSVPQTIAFVGGTSVPGGDLIAHVPTSGTMVFDDPDLTDTHTVSVKLLLNGLNLPPTPLDIFEKALTASIGTDSTGTGFGTVNWKLADLPVYLGDFIPRGEILTLVYAVTVTDSQGATSTQDITVTITGTDTPAVVWIATANSDGTPGGLWSTASNWETGTVPTINDDAIVITNQLIGLTPSFPLTINAPAEAKSLTMNDFGTTPPEIINESTLTIGGAFNMAADSILHNSGTVAVGGLMEVLDTSVVDNSGTLKLELGGDFSGQSTITNSGLIEISGGTLNVDVDVANFREITGSGEDASSVVDPGQITIDADAALSLGIATITGGTVTNDGTLTLDGSNPVSGEVTLTGLSVLKDGTLNNNGALVAATGAVLENETVNNAGTIEVLALGALLLDQGTIVHNTGGTITVDGTGTLTLDDATIDGGTINDYSLATDSENTGVIAGSIDVTGSSTISNAHLTNGQVTIESGQTLTLDGTTVTGTSFADAADGAVIQIDGNKTLTLNDVTITGGTINNYSPPVENGDVIPGSIDVTGSSTISSAHLNNGNVTIASGQTLTLSGDTVTGASFTATGATIVIDGADTLDDVTITGGTITNTNGTLTVDAGETLKLQDGATITGGTLVNFGTIEIEGSQGLILDGVTVTGTGTIQVDDDLSPTQPPLILEGGTTFTGGTMTVGDVGALLIESAEGATLNDEIVTNKHSIEVFAGSALTLGLATAINNTSGAIVTIDGTGTLTLDDATIDGGTINNYSLAAGSKNIVAGDIDVTGSSTISHAHLNNGNVTVEGSQTLTLEGDTVTGADFTATGATIVIDGADTLDNVTVTGGTLTNSGAILTIDADSALTLQGGASLVGGSLVNSGTLHIETVSGATLDHVTVTGSGSIQVDVSSPSGASTLVLDNGTVITGGDLTVGQYGTLAVKTAGGATLNGVKVTNDNSIEVFAGAILTLDQVTTVDNSTGIFTIDGTGTLTLNDAAINYGTVTNSGSLNLDGKAALKSGTLNNYSQINASGTANVFDGETIVNSGAIAILALGALTLDDVATVDNSHGVITVYGTGTLTLNDATIGGGTINDYSAGAENSIVAGDIDITGSSVIHDAQLNHGDVTIEGGVTLTLDNDTVTGTVFTGVAAGAVIQIDGNTTLKLDGATIGGATINDYSTGAENSLVAGNIDITGSSVIHDAHLNHGDVAIEAGQQLTLDNDTVTGTVFTNVAKDSIIHVDGGDTLTLTDATITGGGVTIGAGALVKTGGDVTLTTAITNDGTIEVTGGTLKIVGSVDGGAVGSFQIDGGAVLDIDASDAQHVVFSGDGGTLQIDGAGFTGSISGLVATDKIELSTIGYGLNTTASYVSNADHTGGVLTVTDGHNSISMTLVGDYSNAHFAGSADGNGTLITLNANDDAPVFADKAESAAVTELANTTNSPASDPSPAASGTLHFTDIDLTDRPTMTGIAQSVTWTDSGLALSSTEIQALEHAFSVTQPVNTNNGTLGWTYQISDNALDFLGDGVTATVTSTITLDDHQGHTDTATVTVTIEGSNDLPTIAGETNPATQTIVLTQPPVVLGAGVTGNSLGLHTETFDEISAGSESNNGFRHGNFTSADLGGATFTASGNAGVVHGSSSVTAAPFVGPLPGHADTTNYLSIGANGSETISFATDQNQFGLYWGSADSFNTIKFYEGDHLVASYSGADVAPLLANGNQGSFSAAGYVQFTDLVPFDKVVLASGDSNAFEIDNISAGFVSDAHVHLAPVTGTLLVNDADVGDTLTASVTGNAVATYNGSTTLPSDINVSSLIASGAIKFDTVTTTGGQDVLHWSYNPANANLDFLEPGDTLTLTFNAAVSDGHATTANQALTITLVGNGASVVNGTAQDDTFADVGNGVTISGHTGHDTYNFNAHFGSATITDFDVTNDVINISSTLFSSTTALLNSAVGSNGNTVITDSAGDKITLDHVNVSQLTSHPGDFQFVIANGGSFEAGASTSENVLFGGSTGKLTIDTPASFTGTISGFTGDGTLQGSDQIDLKGIDYHSSSFSESFDAASDTLSVTDGAHSALLHFNGTYQAANFSFVSDNQGGTIVYDPPVGDTAAAKAPASAPAPAVTANSHGFVFNFPDNGHDSSGVHPSDTHLFDGQTFVNAEAGLNRPHDDGHDHAAGLPDSMDAATIAAVKAQLHAHDFHFV